jgi:glycosyltransferase involved in cell wall biosynthesis
MKDRLMGRKRSSHVAIVYQMDRPGGVQSCVLAVIKGLNRRGIIPEILWDVEPNWAMLQRAGVEACYRRIKFPIPSILIEKLPFSLRYLAWMANIIDDDGRYYEFTYIFYNGFLISSDQPHVRYLSGPPLLPQLFTYSRGPRGAPIRFFRWLYQRWIYQHRPVYEFHRGDRYVINSQYTCTLFEQAHGVKLPVIYPPIDLSGRSFDINDWSRRDTLTFFSRMVDYKRPEMVLELAAHHPQMRCLMMGGVSKHRQPFYRALQEKARQYGLQNYTFLANPTNEEVVKELARTRYYVFPAINEHFGMTTAEAIASGAIPYVHDSGGQIEIVVDSRLRFVDPEYHDQFDRLTKTPDTEMNQIRATLTQHVRQFSEEVFIEKMLSFLG